MELVNKDLILLDINVSYRDDAIRVMADKMEECGYLNNRSEFTKDVISRENERPTSIGYSIAVPQARSQGVDKACIGFMRFNIPIQWDSHSKQVKIALMVGAPKGPENYTNDIQRLVFTNVLQESFRKSLLSAKDQEEIYNIFNNLK